MRRYLALFALVSSGAAWLPGLTCHNPGAHGPSATGAAHHASAAHVVPMGREVAAIAQPGDAHTSSGHHCALHVVHCPSAGMAIRPGMGTWMLPTNTGVPATPPTGYQTPLLVSEPPPPRIS